MAGLKFRVLLDSKDKNEIFRDILISDKESFETFYKTILNAYNFTEDQMASFYMSNDNWDKGHEISLFDMSFGEDPDQILPGVMSTSTISDFVVEADQKIILVHDFLRMWIFLIELIGFTEETPERPKNVLSVGNAPAEDSKSAEGDGILFETESEDEEEEDEFGFGEFEDDYEY
jgi:hypothetical protein